MTPFISLSIDGKSLYFVDENGSATELNLETTNGVILSVTNGKISATNAGSTTPTGTPKTITMSTDERWSIRYDAANNDQVSLVGIDDVSGTMKMESHSFNLDTKNHFVKKSGNDLIITPA